MSKADVIEIEGTVVEKLPQPPGHLLNQRITTHPDWNMDISQEQSKADVLIEALPYFQEFYGSTVLVKFGGSAMEDMERAFGVLRDIAFMSVAGLKPIVVHGGGKAINAELAREGVQPRFINGLRYTDSDTIRVVDRVLHEVVNASLVNFLRRDLHVDSTPVSGKNILRCQKIGTVDEATGKELDLGFVGKVVNVDTPQIQWILARHQIPVITPLAHGGTANRTAESPPSGDRIERSLSKEECPKTIENTGSSLCLVV